jgi:hypothetical protein
MADLFQTTFEKYGAVRRYPKFCRISGYHWCVYCDLDSSFGFLLLKTTGVPQWVMEHESAFLSFFAGYFDAEGCISFDCRQSSHAVSLIVESCDYLILREVTERSRRLGFGVKPNLAIEAGRKGCNHDCWSVRVGKRKDARELLRRLELRHPEKVAQKRLVGFLMDSNWRHGWHEAKKLRARVRNEVLLFRKAAADELAARGAEEASTTRAMSRPPRNTTAHLAAPRSGKPCRGGR